MAAQQYHFSTAGEPIELVEDPASTQAMLYQIQNAEGITYATVSDLDRLRDELTQAQLETKLIKTQHEALKELHEKDHMEVAEALVSVSQYLIMLQNRQNSLLSYVIEVETRRASTWWYRLKVFFGMEHRLPPYTPAIK